MYGVPLQIEQRESIGIAMHPWLAKLSHSCEPNAVVTFRPRMGIGGDHNMYVCPLRMIQADEKITVAFTEATAPLSLRQQDLKLDHFFDCKCNKCVGETYEELAAPTKDQLSILGQVNDVLDAADEDTTRYLPIQRLRYALQLLESCAWSSAEHPYPSVLRRLVKTYAEDQQYNLAFAFAAVLRKSNKINYPRKDGYEHPQRMADDYVFIRLMDKIIDGDEWASQKLDLTGRELNLVGLRCHWVEQLRRDEQKVQAWAFSVRNPARYVNEIIRQDHEAGDALKDKEKRNVSVRAINALADEVLERVKEGHQVPGTSVGWRIEVCSGS